MWRKKFDAQKDRGRGGRGPNNGSDRLRANSADYTERVFHDEEFGEENVELVDEEWASFERVLRDFRERRLLKASMDNLPLKKKSRKKRAQAFYPMPMPGMSEDQDSISTVTSDDEAYDTDEDGYITTLSTSNNNGITVEVRCELQRVKFTACVRIG
ncbi:hypothetical protein RP20_CCG025168 [Aedes albopictus]|nr:hypothetical protein RP20_CCG025168 [Aedes albopictus]